MKLPIINDTVMKRQFCPLPLLNEQGESRLPGPCSPASLLLYFVSNRKPYYFASPALGINHEH